MEKTNVTDASKLLRVPEFAIALSIQPKTVWAWIGARKITTHRIGRCVRIPASEVQRILDEGCQPAREAGSR
jgi:excisionase family DNA binding protein